MNNLSKLGLGVLLSGSLGLASCEKQLDINNNPNLPSSVSPELVLPAGTANLSYVLGGQYQIVGGLWAQYWTQNYVQNQYKEQDKYNINRVTFDGPFVTLFAGAQQDFQFVIDRTRGDSSNYAAIAGLEQAFTYQVLSDAYDQVPFTEALKGAQNTKPIYDKGPVVYDGIINLINASVNKINTTTSVRVGNQDIVFGGDMDKWQRFANTLKLRVYLRQIYARRPVAEAGIRALYAANAQFLGPNENAEVAVFTTTNKNGNPLYLTELYGGSAVKENLIGSATIIGYLNGVNDPRVDDYYDRPGNSPTAAHVGTRQGAAGVPGAPAPAISTRSRPDLVNILGPTAPVILISGAESQFLQAEASLYGFGAANTPKALYEAGVEAAFDRVGRAVPAGFLASAPIDLDNAIGVEAKLDRIITQKWVSMAGSQAFEAWSELRRTNYPSFIVPSASSSLRPGVIANRFQYPDSEGARNPNTPPLEQTETPVWWDVKPL